MGEWKKAWGWEETGERSVVFSWIRQCLWLGAGVVVIGTAVRASWGQLERRWSGYSVLRLPGLRLPGRLLYGLRNNYTARQGG